MESDYFLKVYSHPRSGTHLLETFIGVNFYEGMDLSIDQITWGHWSNRRVKNEGNPYGLLFGNHYFPDKNKTNFRKIYIFRDGLSVAYSIWKTDNFLNKKMSALSYDNFLREEIDWFGSPSQKSFKNLNILEHWAFHVTKWLEFANNNDNVLIIRYEDLVSNPYAEYCKIRKKFFNTHTLKNRTEINIINNPVGLLPNKGVNGEWKNKISIENEIYYYKLLKEYNLNF
ncbi:sulfotransferase domain-containing protein [Zunongwangia sp. SCSIO 43204]|uniref:sulfotransferase domain-containing protein n=1 Tax=Zunongwangia sp. SCSIO 43204 TaxID=2779359 RepID=UPI001CA87B7E|nr:sulfotransferase domain-containing protein [Zunongwangia sp. SCSIO 43204]UAB86164.1 sulfotransferase domain-containing protein [Zunongwangia sp. SCSIO 43204]